MNRSILLSLTLAALPLSVGGACSRCDDGGGAAADTFARHDASPLDTTQAPRDTTTTPRDTGSLGDTQIAPLDGGDAGGTLEISARAPSLSEAEIRDRQTLGPTVVDGGANFSVYSEHAERIELLLFDDPDGMPSYRIPMVRLGDVWNIFVEGLGDGTLYGYIAWGPNWPYDPAFEPGSDTGFIADVDALGNRYNPNKLLIDPYAKVVNRDHIWSKGIPATGHGRKQNTWDAGAKSVIVHSDYEWSAGEVDWQARRADIDAPGNGWQEQIVYEVHVKGFTQIPSSGVDDLGTFLGFAEKVDYLVDLGVTAVELLPIHEKPLDDGGYWGYNNLSYFSPENSYASATEPVGYIDEFKYMVDVLHQHGIEVWVDVVYNHTGEGGLWTERPPGFAAKDTVSLYSWRGLDNQAYYALTDDNQGYWPNTGVGNQTRANYHPFKQLIMDSLHYYVEEMHVDGFRFDLAPAIAAADGDYDRWDNSPTNVVKEIINDPLFAARNTRIIAEPWAAGGDYSFSLGHFPVSNVAPGAGWYEWNANYRDWWREFVNIDTQRLSTKAGALDGGGSLTGSYDIFNASGRRPYHSVNFVTIHDGMTMYDLFTYDEKQNGCGPLVPICCTKPESPWCDPEGGEDNNRSRDWGDDNEPMKRQLMRDLFVAMMISHGTPLIYGGDEWLRTQLGNNNAWTASGDNSSNWFQWGSWRLDDERQRMHDFVTQLIAFRKARLAALAPTTYSFSGFVWRSASGEGDPDWNSRHIALYYDAPPAGIQPFIILINLERHQVEFTLPAGSWRRLVDTQRWFDDDEFLGGTGIDPQKSHNISLTGGEVITGVYGAADSSVVILELTE